MKLPYSIPSFLSNPNIHTHNVRESENLSGGGSCPERERGWRDGGMDAPDGDKEQTEAGQIRRSAMPFFFFWRNVCSLLCMKETESSFLRFKLTSDPAACVCVSEEDTA